MLKVFYFYVYYSGSKLLKCQQAAQQTKVQLKEEHGITTSAAVFLLLNFSPCWTIESMSLLNAWCISVFSKALLALSRQTD